MTYFISGHRDLDLEDFDHYYGHLIYKAATENAEFVIGDYEGVDKMAMHLLWQWRLNNVFPDVKVTVYHMFDSPRNNPGWPTVGGFKTDEERDAAMTAASERDIAWVRPGKERSGTAQNIARRIKDK
jgi:hypothetical protein